jgi:hypothetical protein
MICSLPRLGRIQQFIRKRLWELEIPRHKQKDKVKMDVAAKILTGIKVHMQEILMVMNFMV